MNQADLTLTLANEFALWMESCADDLPVFLVKGDSFNPPLRINAYMYGSYIFFREGSQADHIDFLRACHGENYEEIVEATSHVGLYCIPALETIKRWQNQETLTKNND
jgi:hypothetical protein